MVKGILQKIDTGKTLSPRLTDDDIDVRHIRDLRADDEELSTSRNQLKQVSNDF